MNKPTKALPPSTRHTRRWPASLAVVAVLVLQVLVPTQINALPRWLMPVLGGLLLLPLVWMNPFHLRRDEPWLRRVELVLLAVLVAVNAYYLAGMIFFLNNGDANEGKVLVKSALLIWVTNVVAFAVWYWEIDRGGPFARAPEHERETERADLLFPQMTVDLPGWKRLAARIHRLPVRRTHQRDRVQPDRHAAADGPDEDADGDSVGDRAAHRRDRRGPRGERPLRSPSTVM